MQVTSRQLVVLGTGGTIAGAAVPGGGSLAYQAGAVALDTLMAGLPVPAGLVLRTEQVAQVDSKDMSHAVWQALAEACARWLARPEVDGLVITHGTDTLEETAWFLQRVLAPAKPVVLACAMRPATAASADGPQNLLDALAVAATPGARGVVAVCAGRVHGAQDVTKVHPWRTDAFSSGESGPVALVVDGRVRQLRDWPDGTARPQLLAAVGSRAMWPRVELVASHAGSDGRLLDLLVRDGVDGLVVATTGNGSVHTAVLAAAARAVEAGVMVLRASRCLEGRPIAVEEDGLDLCPLTPPKARVELLLRLMAP